MVEKKKVSIADILAMDTEVILLDGPTISRRMEESLGEKDIKRFLNNRKFLKHQIYKFLGFRGLLTIM